MKKIVLVLVLVLTIAGPAFAGPIDWLFDLVGYSPTSQLIAARAEISRLESVIVVLTRINWVGVMLIVLLVITGEVLRRWTCGIFRKAFKRQPLLDPAVKAAFEEFQAEAIASAKAARAAAEAKKP